MIVIIKHINIFIYNIRHITEKGNAILAKLSTNFFDLHRRKSYHIQAGIEWVFIEIINIIIPHISTWILCKDCKVCQYLEICETELLYKISCLESIFCIERNFKNSLILDQGPWSQDANFNPVYQLFYFWNNCQSFFECLWRTHVNIILLCYNTNSHGMTIFLKTAFGQHCLSLDSYLRKTNPTHSK